MTLKFPFVEVGELELAFPVVPNYDEVMAAVPEEYSNGQNVFLSAASGWLAGTFDASKDLPGYKVTASDMDEAMMQRDYIQVWTDTWEPKLEEKLQVIGWLLSLVFEKPE